MIKAVIFDYSGVLANDLSQSWQALSKILELYGKKPDSLEDFRRNFKLPYWNYFIEKGLSLEDAKGRKIPEYYIRFYDEMIKHVTIFPEVKETIADLQKNSIKLAIVSQTPRNLIDTVLERYDLIHQFDIILGLYDYKEQKPSPEPIKIVLDRLGLASDEAVYVGDMQEDIIAARRVGMKSIAISREDSYHSRSYLEQQKPDFLIDDLRKISEIVSGHS